MGRIIRWFFFASASFVLLMQLRGLDSGLISSSTPMGILGYELAFSAERARAMLEVWTSMGVLDTVRASLGVDMVFLFVYPWFFRSSIGLLVRRSPKGSALAMGVEGAVGKGDARDTLDAGSAGAALGEGPRKAVANLGWFYRFGEWLSRAVLACIVLDIVENVVLWRMLESGVTSMGAMVSGLVAVAKFGLVIASTLWCFLAIADRLFRRR